MKFKKFLPLFSFLFLTITLQAVNRFDNLLVLWANSYKKTVELIESVDCNKPESANLLRVACDSLLRSVNYLEKAKIENGQYPADLSVRYTTSAILFASLHEDPCGKSAFNIELTKKILAKAILDRPTSTSITTSDIKLNASVTKDMLDNSFAKLLYHEFCISKELGDSTSKISFGKAFINHLSWMKNGNSTFVKLLASDKEWTLIKYLEKVLSEVNFQQDTKEYKNKMVLELEIAAYNYENSKKSNPDFKDDLLNSISIASIITGCGLEFDAQKKDDNPFILRIIEAVRILENWNAYQRFYTDFATSNGASERDRWSYIDSMHVLMPRADNIEVSMFQEESLDQEIKRGMLEVVDLLYQNLSLNASIEDYERLLKEYQFLNDKDGIAKTQVAIDAIGDARMRKEKSEKFHQKWGLSFGFAPIKTLAFKGAQKSFFVDVKTFGISYGGRLCLYNHFTDGSRFYAWTKKNGELGSTTTYNGYEASYWIGLASFRDDFVSQQIVFEYRRGHYEFSPLTNATMLSRSIDVADVTNVTVDPLGKSNDFTFVYRLRLYPTKFLFVEGNVGAGIGYRTLSANYDLKKYSIDNISFNDDRWPSITLPIRFGLRFGVTLF